MTESNPALRADARANRARILASARILFAEHGLDTPLDHVARHAGVGSGTLYRHFPHRDDPVVAVFIEELTDQVAAIDAALADPDPWPAFHRYVTATAQVQASNRALAELLATGHRDPKLTRVHDQGRARLVELIDRVKSQGIVRDDMSVDDVLLLYLAVAGVTRSLGSLSSAEVARLTAITLDGFRPLPPTA